jgi:hypothetical protein
LVIRALGASDVEALYRLFGDREQMRFWGHEALESRAEAEAYLAEIQAGAEAWDAVEAVDAWRLWRLGIHSPIGNRPLINHSADHRINS